MLKNYCIIYNAFKIYNKKYYSMKLLFNILKYYAFKIL